MAVAGINNVSVLESSYFGDNYTPVSRRFGNQEKPITRTSFIRKLWHDLEDGSRVRNPQRKQTSMLVNSNIGSHCSCSSEDAESEEDMSLNTSEAENECPKDQNQILEDNQNLCFQHSPAIGSADKERVRQVFSEWKSKNNNCENESKRVRTVRQWLESNVQQAENGQSVVEEQDGLGGDCTVVDARRSIRLRYGRHALLDLLTRFQMERNKEMQSLMESRPVSTFAHRKRLQVLLKGRFLWNQRFVQDEKSTSTAACELGVLRQTQTVSDLRKGFLSRVNNHEQQAHNGPQSDNLSDNGTNYQENQLLEDIVNESETSSENDITYQENQPLVDIVNGNSSNNGLNYQESQLVEDIVNESETPAVHDIVNGNESEEQLPLPPPTEIFESRYESDVDEREVDQTFDHLNPSETETDVLSWQEEMVEAQENLSINEPIHSFNANSIENQDDWMYHYENHPVVTTDAFYTHDDDNENNTRLELQRLMSRRSVSSLLESDFRGRLDQLLQSYVARQDQASESDEDWMLEAGHQDPYQQSVYENEHENDEVDETADPANSWQQHPETELEIINSLRMDMVLLQERMNSMQNTLEACMKMQLELQRSVQQEVSSALNRSSNSGKESLQSCFLCCDSESDSSPNRGGHVYVCANCAEKINWSKIKESVRHP